MAMNYMLPLRAVQAVFTIIVLGLTAYCVDYWWVSPHSFNFMLFTSVWTILALAYLIVAPLRFKQFSHKYAILGAEALTMIFWFAAFVSVASYLGDVRVCQGRVCDCAKAAVVFASFTWLLFAITTAMAAIHVKNTRKTGEKSHDPNAEVHPGV